MVHVSTATVVILLAVGYLGVHSIVQGIAKVFTGNDKNEKEKK